MREPSPAIVSGIPTARRLLRSAISWGLVGTVFAGGSVVSDVRAGREYAAGAALIGAALFVAIWWVLGLAVLALGERYPLSHGRRLLRLAVYAGCGVGVSAVHVGIYVPVSNFLARAFAIPDLNAPSPTIPALFFWNLIMFALTALIATVIAAEERARTAATRSAGLALQLERANALAAEARVSALEAQIQPHFLFNTLHSVMVLMHRDVVAASSTLTRLSDLLRHALAAGASAETSLGDEVAFATGYLDIERVRFPDRLQVFVEVPAALREARVPRLVLQPLVENAVRHGVARRAGPSTVRIAASQAGATLVIEVADRAAGDGSVGAPMVARARASTGNGLGVGNIHERLQVLYGTAASLTVSVSDDEATSRMSLPLQLPPHSASGRSQPA